MQTVSHKTKPLASCFISILCLQGHQKLQVHAEMYKFNAAHSSNSLTSNVIQPFPGCWGLCLKKTSVLFSRKFSFFWPTLRLLSPAWLGTYHQIAARLAASRLCLGLFPTSSLRSLKCREIGGCTVSLIMRLVQWEHKEEISLYALFCSQIWDLLTTINLSIYIYMYIYV